MLIFQQTEKLSSSAQNKSVSDNAQIVHEVTNCPNKANSYHECVRYCSQRWGLKQFNPSPVMCQKRAKVLKKYPMPPHWLEVADPET